MMNRRQFLRRVLGALSFLGFPKLSKALAFTDRYSDSVKMDVLRAYDERGLDIFWGDIHGHTGFSDGYGLPEEYFHTARYDNSLDIAAMSDHACIINKFQQQLIIGDGEKSLWQLTIDAVNENYDPGNFVTLLGFEWTSSTYGHRNVYFRDTVNVPERPLSYLEYVTPKDLWNALAKYDVFIVPHHPMRWREFIDTSYQNNEMERLVEIHSKWGSSEHAYADYEPMGKYIDHPRLRQFAEGHAVIDMLNQNFMLGIIGGTDTHQGLPGSTIRDEMRGILFDPDSDPHPETVGDFLRLLEEGYTFYLREPRLGGNGALLAVFSETLTRESVWDSLYNRHTYASTGARAALYFSIRDTANITKQVIMGDEMYVDGDPEILVYVSGEFGSVIKDIQVIKNGKLMLAKRFNEKDATLRFVDSLYDGRPSYYLIKVREVQGENSNYDNDLEYYKWEKHVIGPKLEELLWSSPIWVYKNK